MMRRIWMGMVMTVVGASFGLGLGHAVATQEKAATDALPTAQEDVVEEIKGKVGMPWMAETVDTFKAGDPETRVTGMAQ